LKRRELILLPHAVQNFEQQLTLAGTPQQGKPPVATARNEMQLPLVVTPFEFVAWDDEVSAAHPLPKPQRVRHPQRKTKPKSTATAPTAVVSSVSMQRQAPSTRTKGAPPAFRVLFWRRLCLFVACTLPVALFWPALAALGYHVLRGDQISVEGLRVQVPRHFYPIGLPKPNKFEVLSLFSSLTVVSYVWHDDGAIITFLKAPQPHYFTSSALNQFAIFFTADAHERGFYLRSISAPSVAGRRAHCLTFASNASPNQTLERCALEDSSVSIVFEGSSKYQNDFDSILKLLQVD
jgi:hypothetical protein